MDLARRIHEAIVASGKTRLAIAMEADTTMETLSRIVSGSTANPGIHVLARIARACGTTVGALLGETPIELTSDDLAAMRRMRDWIDRKLAERGRQELVRDAGDEIPRDFRRLGARLVFRVQGDALRDLGILSGDLLYVAPTAASSAGQRLVICRAGVSLYVRSSSTADEEVVGIVIGRLGTLPPR